MQGFALWQRLDRPGHDAALLTRSDDGWLLRGTSVFRHPHGPACVHYGVSLDAAWRTTAGEVAGFVADRNFRHTIRRGPEGWCLDDAVVDGLGHVLDLDYGFTPATNLQQLRRADLRPGQTVDLPVAWFDIDAAVLLLLPQSYRRMDQTSYWYRAPTVPYEGLLTMAPNGFVWRYPGLWQMEVE